MNWRGHKFMKGLLGLWLPDGLGTQKEQVFGPSPVKMLMGYPVVFTDKSSALAKFGELKLESLTQENAKQIMRAMAEDRFRAQHSERTGHEHETVEGAALCEMLG